MLTIDDDKPVPEQSRRNGKGYTEVVLRLKPGQSVYLPVSLKHAYQILHNLDYARGVIERTNYAWRREGEGSRIWRLK